MRLRVLNLHWEELTHTELIDVVRDSRINGHQRHTTERVDSHRFLISKLNEIQRMGSAHLYDFALDLKDGGALAEALTCYQTLYSRFPEKHKALVGQAFCLAELNRLPEARLQIDLLHEKWPRQPDGLYLKGIIAQKMGKPDESLSLISEVLEQDPNWAVAWSHAGIVELDQGHFDRAITYLSRAIDLSPQLKDSIFNRGYTQMKKGDSTAAIVDFRRVLSLSPYDHDAALYLANLLYAENPQTHRDDIVRSYVIAYRGNPREAIRVPLMTTLALVPMPPQFPHFSLRIPSNPEMTYCIELTNHLCDHRYYREALQLWCDLAEKVDVFLGAPHARLQHETTILYWIARNDFRGQGTIPAEVPLERCDEAEAVFRTLLKDLLAIGTLPSTFDTQLVANIWMQLSQIDYSRSEHTDEIPKKMTYLETAIKFAKHANRVSPSSGRQSAIEVMAAEKESLGLL